MTSGSMEDSIPKFEVIMFDSTSESCLPLSLATYMYTELQKKPVSLKMVPSSQLICDTCENLESTTVL